MAEAPSSSLYRAVWRWHFYAGLLVLPFLVLLAVTGALCLDPGAVERLRLRDACQIAPDEPLAQIQQAG